MYRRRRSSVHCAQVDGVESKADKSSRSSIVFNNPLSAAKDIVLQQPRKCSFYAVVARTLTGTPLYCSLATPF